MIRIASLYDDLAASMAVLRSSHEAVSRSRDTVLQALGDGMAHYGINTGFGALSNKRIDEDQLSNLQRNILLSHACGVGDPPSSASGQWPVPLPLRPPPALATVAAAGWVLQNVREFAYARMATSPRPLGGWGSSDQ